MRGVRTGAGAANGLVASTRRRNRRPSKNSALRSTQWWISRNWLKPALRQVKAIRCLKELQSIEHNDFLSSPSSNYLQAAHNIPQLLKGLTIAKIAARSRLARTGTRAISCFCEAGVRLRRNLGQRVDDAARRASTTALSSPSPYDADHRLGARRAHRGVKCRGRVCLAPGDRAVIL